jgi:hypothetical protein
MDLKTTLRNRVNPGGLWVVGSYWGIHFVLTCLAPYAIPRSTLKPEEGASHGQGSQVHVSLSRLNHGLSMREAHLEVMQGTAEFHHHGHLWCLLAMEAQHTINRDKLSWSGGMAYAPTRRALCPSR